MLVVAARELRIDGYGQLELEFLLENTQLIECEYIRHGWGRPAPVSQMWKITTSYKPHPHGTRTVEHQIFIPHERVKEFAELGRADWQRRNALLDGVATPLATGWL
jgi:hypothetical protein